MTKKKLSYQRKAPPSNLLIDDALRPRLDHQSRLATPKSAILEKSPLVYEIRISHQYEEIISCILEFIKNNVELATDIKLLIYDAKICHLGQRGDLPLSVKHKYIDNGILPLVQKALQADSPIGFDCDTNIENKKLWQEFAEFLEKFVLTHMPEQALKALQNKILYRYATQVFSLGFRRTSENVCDEYCAVIDDGVSRAAFKDYCKKLESWIDTKAAEENLRQWEMYGAGILITSLVLGLIYKFIPDAFSISLPATLSITMLYSTLAMIGLKVGNYAMANIFHPELFRNASRNNLELMWKTYKQTNSKKNIVELTFDIPDDYLAESQPITALLAKSSLDDINFDVKKVSAAPSVVEEEPPSFASFKNSPSAHKSRKQLLALQVTTKRKTRGTAIPRLPVVPVLFPIAAEPRTVEINRIRYPQNPNEHLVNILDKNWLPSKNWVIFYEGEAWSKYKESRRIFYPTRPLVGQDTDYDYPLASDNRSAGFKLVKSSSQNAVSFFRFRSAKGEGERFNPSGWFESEGDNFIFDMRTKVSPK